MVSRFSTASLVLAASVVAVSASAQLVVNTDLGELSLGSSTNIAGDTAVGADNATYYNVLNPTLSWGNELVFEFSIGGTSNVNLDVTSNSLTGDPDFILLDGLTVELDASGIAFGSNALDATFLDGAVGDTEVLGINIAPGTYFLSVDSFGAGTSSIFDINLGISEFVPPEPPLAMPLGEIATTADDFQIDSLGSAPVDTEFGLYDSNGTLIGLNDDIDFDNDIFESGFAIGAGDLDAGTYYLAVGEFNTVYGDNFDAVSEAGSIFDTDYVLNYVDQSMNLTIPAGDVDWVSFEIGEGSVFLSADFNQDGIVNLLDLDILGQNWEMTGTSATGDANGDGVVNLLDLDALGQQWELESSFAAALSAAGIVPEPASIALLGAGAMLMARRR